MSASDNQAQSEQEIVSEVPFRSVTPNDRKHKYEEGGDLAHECTSSRASKCQRSNSLGSYFVPIVPSVENSVQESQLQFDELEIVDTVNSSCQQPESVFHFIPVTDSNHTNRARQDESRVSLCSDSKCTSNFADEHVLSCSHPSCDDLNSDPRFFQSQSAPAQLLTDESEHLLLNPSVTTNTSPNPAFPAISEASPKSPSKVTSASDFEYKLFDVSSAEKRRRVSTSTAREDVNAEDFDNYTTGNAHLFFSLTSSFLFCFFRAVTGDHVTITIASFCVCQQALLFSFLHFFRFVYLYAQANPPCATPLAAASLPAVALSETITLQGPALLVAK